MLKQVSYADYAATRAAMGPTSTQQFMDAYGAFHTLTSDNRTGEIVVAHYPAIGSCNINPQYYIEEGR